MNVCRANRLAPYRSVACDFYPPERDPHLGVNHTRPSRNCTAIITMTPQIITLAHTFRPLRNPLRFINSVSRSCVSTRTGFNLGRPIFPGAFVWNDANDIRVLQLMRSANRALRPPQYRSASSIDRLSLARRFSGLGRRAQLRSRRISVGRV